MRKFITILLAICLFSGMGFVAEAHQAPKVNKSAPASSQKTAQYKKKIVGTYLLNTGACMGTTDMVHDFGKYVITESNISFYSWDQRKNNWHLDYCVPYTIKYNKTGYMRGYCIKFTVPGQYGGPRELCTGDTDNDGRMDLWMSDSMYWTRQ